jgi:hypothetical protein
MPITLAGIKLTGVQNIRTNENRALVRHRIPGLEGDLIQDLGRRPVSISFDGIFKGKEALKDIEKLRQKFKKKEAIAFVSDITDSTDVTEVVIDNLRVTEVAGKANHYRYYLVLEEYIPPPPPPANTQARQQQAAKKAQAQQVQQVANNTGTIEVRVELEEGETDYTGISVLIEGTTDDGQDYSVTINNHENGVFTAENVPDGEYTASISSQGD